MITVGIENTVETGKHSIDFLETIMSKSSIKLKIIEPTESILYSQHKRIRLKEYIDFLANKKEIDVLIIKLNKEGLKNNIYEKIYFHAAVLFAASVHNAKLANNKAYLSQKLMRAVPSEYYILPDSYKLLQEKSITYGWSQKAHICATSSELTVDGNTSLQYCIQNTLPILFEEDSTPSEHCIHANIEDVEAVLAGVATMLLYSNLHKHGNEISIYN